MRGTSGLWLIAIGVLHTVYGCWQGYGLLTQLTGASFPSETSRQAILGLGRNSVFWFLFGGFVMLVLGHTFVWFERRFRRPIPAVMGWELLALSLIGVMFLPRSGFWFILALSAYMIVAAQRATTLTAGGQ
jgi:Family of unknown function (DUF6463)